MLASPRHSCELELSSRERESWGSERQAAQPAVGGPRGLEAMNALTQIRNTQRASRNEVAAGLADKASWHDQFRGSAYIYAGGLSFDLTEGDLLAVFAQYGEIVDVDLCRDRETGKQRGFAFLAYADQRSTVLAVDNLNGARVLGRTVRVEHVADYRRRKQELDGGEEGNANAVPLGPGPSSRVKQDVDGADPPKAADREDRAGGPAPWEAQDSVFQILREAREAVYGDATTTDDAPSRERERSRGRGRRRDRDEGGDDAARPRRRHRHKHRHRRAKNEDAGA